MSVLSFPRIYFNGYMMWDPTTANNNDYSTIYDPAHADLDWDYLAKQNPPITRENFQQKFRPWNIQPVKDVCDNPSPSDTIPPVVNADTKCPPEPPVNNFHMGSRWSYFGGGGSAFMDYTPSDPRSKNPARKTLTTGGDTAYSQSALPSDAILNKPVVLEGNVFGDKMSMARLVDINPATPFCSQIFFSKITVGDDETYISGPRRCRMFSRAFFAPRTISPDLMIAGGIGVIFQTTMSYDSLKIVNGGNSALLTSLQKAMQASGAEGLMIRFSTYNTLYYQNGVYNDIKTSVVPGKPNPATACELSKMWQAGDIFMNPAYSRVVGALGVWNTGELSSVPGGHLLVPVRKIYPVDPLKTQETQTHGGEFLGIAGKSLVMSRPHRASETKSSGGPPPNWPQGTSWAEIDYANRRIALDLMNTIFEHTLNPSTNDGQKTDYGTVRVGVGSLLTFQQIGTFDYNQYDLAAYLKQSGLVDVPFDSDVTADDVRTWLKDGELMLQVQQQGQWQTFSAERALTADTDDRGVYIDQNPKLPAEIKVQIRYKNGAPPANTFLHVAQYFPFPLFAGSGVLQKFPAPDTPWSPDTPVCQQTPNPNKPYVKFVDGDVVPVSVSGANDWGEAILRLSPEHPGFPNIVFYPFQPATVPPPPAMPPPPPTQGAITFGFPGNVIEVASSFLLIGNTGYSAVRVMQFDTAPLDGKVSPLVDFVECWNAVGPYAGQPQFNRVAIWKWIYSNILYVYDMLFPVMDPVMPLHNLERVEGAIDQLVIMIQKDWVNNSTLYMPVTRDLSAAKRLILETWGNLVIRKYPQQPLPPLTPPT